MRLAYFMINPYEGHTQSSLGKSLLVNFVAMVSSPVVWWFGCKRACWLFFFHSLQVSRIRELLKRGLGVHHSGVLPIIKEVNLNPGVTNILMAFCWSRVIEILRGAVVDFKHNSEKSTIKARLVIPEP